MIFAGDHSDEMAKVTVTAFVEEDIKDGLKALANAERRSMSQMMSFLIEKAIIDARSKGVIPQAEQQGK